MPRSPTHSLNKPTSLFINFLIAAAAIMFSAWGLSFLTPEIQATSLLMLFSAILTFLLIYFLITGQVPGGEVLGKVYTRDKHPRFYWTAFSCHAGLLLICLSIAVSMM